MSPRPDAKRPSDSTPTTVQIHSHSAPPSYPTSAARVPDPRCVLACSPPCAYSMCIVAPRTPLGARWGRKSTAETLVEIDELIESRRVAVVEITGVVDRLTTDVAAGGDPFVAAVVAGVALVRIGGLP